MFTIINPIETAIMVVIRYIPIVLPPIKDSLDMSLRSETPLINELIINGIAISFRAFMNIVPKGFTQSKIKALPFSNLVKTAPQITPSNIPRIILRCNGSFFIYYFLIVLLSKIKSAITSAAIASTIGTALGTTQGSCLPLPCISTASPLLLIVF